MNVGRVPTRWVMVTGAMRSGTTFVGRVLATGYERAYIHEPFNPSCGVVGLPLRLIAPDSSVGREFDLNGAVRDIKSLDVRLRTKRYSTDSMSRATMKQVVGGRGAANVRLARLNPFTSVGIVKDPIGALLAPVLAERHGFGVVAMVRHPVAWYASITRHQFDAEITVESLLTQAATSEGLVTPAEVELMKSGTALERAAVLWNAVYRRLDRDLTPLPSTVFLRHEDLSAAPLQSFQRIAEVVGLPLSDRAVRRIDRLTSGTSIEARSVHDFRRNSAELFAHRLAMVSDVDRDRLLALCGGVARRWYGDETWRTP